MAGATTRGVLFVHSAPRALCPHVEWAAGGVLDVRLTLDWIPQPAAPGMYRTELSWQAEQGTGALLASALRGWALGEPAFVKNLQTLTTRRVTPKPRGRPVSKLPAG